MSQIERIEELRLTTEDDSAIAGLMLRAFGTDFGGRSYFRQRHHLRLIWREDGRILAHMALCMRDVRLAGSLTPIVGLAEVATDPAHRGRGIATALMGAALREARSSVAEFLVLFGDQALYPASGFVPKGNMLMFVSMDDAVTGPASRRVEGGLMVLSLRGQTWDSAAEVDLLGHLF